MFYPRFIGMPTFGSLRPLDELNRMRHQMDRIMDAFLNRPAAVAGGSGVFPAINLTEDENNYYLRAELPGVQNSDLDIQATANSLTISGQRRMESQDETAKYHRREREAGLFRRALSMPKEIDAERVEARLVNGLLTLRVPKSERAKPRKITING